MTAFTSIMAGLSALAGVAGVADARSAQAEQKKRQTEQNKRINQQKLEAQNAARIEAQISGKDADVILGTESVSDALLPVEAILKQTIGKGKGKATRPGGLAATKATNIGGL